MAEPVCIRFERHSLAPVQAVWEVLADTDRFNRAAGLGFDLREEIDAEGQVRRRGRLRRLGMTLCWEEPPARYVVPEWFLCERLFSGGPAARIAVELRLQPTETGTRVHYEVRIEPRSAIGRLLLSVEAWLGTRRQLERTLDAALAVAEGSPAGAYDPPPPPLSTRAAERLQAGLEPLEPSMAEAIGAALRHAPLYRQARLMPRLLARGAGVEEEVALRELLRATRLGLLELRWELLCPSCLSPKASQRTLWSSLEDVHCTTCNIRFDPSFPDAVQVVFRPDPGLRQVDVPVACLVSPGRTPHVVASEWVEPGEPTVLELEARSGGYRLLVGSGLLGGAALEIAPEAPAEAGLTIGRGGVAPGRLTLGTGRIRLGLHSSLERAVRVSVERPWRPPLVLTAGALLALPGCRDLLPAEALRPGMQVKIRRGIALAIHLLAPDLESSLIERATAREDPPELHQVGRGQLLLCWSEPGAALDMAAELAGDARWAVGLGLDRVLILGAADRRSLAGPAVDGALGAALDAGARRVGIQRSSLDDPQLAAQIEQRCRAGKLRVDRDLPVEVLLLDFS